MDDLIVLAVVAGILAAAAGYVYKQKKAGAKCIGCPDSKTCAGHCQSCTGCSCGKETP